MKAYAHWNPRMVKTFIASGAASNATFAVTGILTTDEVIRVLRATGGNGVGFDAVLDQGDAITELTITAAGVCKTPLTATNADRLMIEVVRHSLGDED